MYRLPDELRPLLAQPFGPVYGTERALKECRGRTVISVGDVVTRMFLTNDVLPKLMVIDGLTKRGTRVEAAPEGVPGNVRRVTVVNQPATISQRLLVEMDRAMREKGSTLITVQGEEDLAALPAMIMAPEGTAVAYGQPDEGVVVVLVTRAVRERAQDILQRMEVK